MKNIFLVFIFLPILAFSQCPNTSLVFNTQQEIDNFPIDWPNCKSTENLTIESIPSGSIKNLIGLSQLEKLNGFISSSLIIVGNDSLEYLNGLHNSVTDSTTYTRLDVSIKNNARLKSFLGFPNTMSRGITNLEIVSNANLINLYGLESRYISGSITIENNNNLQSLFGLKIDHTSVNYELKIKGNDNLITLFNPNEFQSNAVDLIIEENQNLINLNGLSSSIIGNDNQALPLCMSTPPDPPCFYLTNDLTINNNPSLISLEGLHFLNNDDNYHLDTFIEVIGNINLETLNNSTLCGIIYDTNYDFTFSNNANGLNTLLEAQISCNQSFPAAPTVYSDKYFLNSGDFANLSANGCNGTVNWYDNKDKTLPIIATGNSFSTPTITGNQFYYAECVENNVASKNLGIVPLSLTPLYCYNSALVFESSVDDIHNSIDYYTEEQITASNKIIGSNLESSYNSAKSIVLNPGFEVNNTNSEVFIAKINYPCPTQ